MIAYRSRSATGSPGRCPDCGMYYEQTFHRCLSYGISASDAAAIINDLSNGSQTLSKDVLKEKRAQSRRDVQEKRRELRHRKVAKR